MEDLLDKLKGTVYGQAIGDALGLGTEFMDDYDMAWKYPNGLTHYSEIYQDRHLARRLLRHQGQRRELNHYCPKLQRLG